ncbi:hypothetical protein DS66_07975 [Mesotoga sp. SC_3PWM13N19]|nr:hypothetical protein DS66_07975 [Mesotoga sp. SC_3PWM13N19]
MGGNWDLHIAFRCFVFFNDRLSFWGCKVSYLFELIVPKSIGFVKIAEWNYRLLVCKHFVNRHLRGSSKDFLVDKVISLVVVLPVNCDNMQ